MGYWKDLMTKRESPRFCFSTEEYREACKWRDDENRRCYYTSIIEEKLIPGWFYLNLPYCDECKKYIEFVDNKCSNHRSHRLLVTCNYCQNDFKTFNDREVRCFVCCQSIQRTLKTYTFEKLKKLANVYNIKRRRRDYIIDDLVQKVENYII